jgi:type IV pilus assembly protein PilQ
MRMKGQRGFFLIWLLAWISSAIGCATPAAAPKAVNQRAGETASAAPDILQDIRVVDRDVHLIFALSDSTRRTYSVFEATDPFRVIVALPNTTSENVATPMAVGSEILNAIETTTVAYDPHPYTKVVIALNYETAYRISRVGQVLVVSFAPAPAPPGGVVAAPAEPREAQPLERKPEETSLAERESSTQLPPEPRAAASARPEAREVPAPAGKLLAIQQRSANQGVQFHLVGDGSLSDYNAFHLSDPPRVVVDLFGVRASEVKRELLLNDSLVRKVRVGVHEGKVRVVFDVIRAAGVPYRVKAEADELAVTFKPGSGFPAH